MNIRRSALAAMVLAASASLGACATYDSYGSQGGYGNAPYGNQPYDPRYGDPRYGSGPGAYDPGYRAGGSVIECESRDRRVTRCAVDTRGGVRLVQRISDAACVRGRSWGEDRGGIWVSNGCRARFEVGGGYGAPRNAYGPPRNAYGPPGNAYGRDGGVVVCESKNDRRAVCGVPRGVREVQLVRQISNTPCRRNANWGYQRGAIWVDRGCRAEFRVY